MTRLIVKVESGGSSGRVDGSASCLFCVAYQHFLYLGNCSTVWHHSLDQTMMHTHARIHRPRQNKDNSIAMCASTVPDAQKLKVKCGSIIHLPVRFLGMADFAVQTSLSLLLIFFPSCSF